MKVKILIVLAVFIFIGCSVDRDILEQPAENNFELVTTDLTKDGRAVNCGQLRFRVRWIGPAVNDFDLRDEIRDDFIENKNLKWALRAMPPTTTSVTELWEFYPSPHRDTCTGGIVASQIEDEPDLEEDDD